MKLHMMKLSALIVACSVVLVGCTVTVNEGGANTVVGSGRQSTEYREVSGVNAVVLSNSGKLIVEYGPTESLTVTADDNILPLLTSRMDGGRLTLGTKPNTSLTTRNPIVYHLTVKDLGALECSGSGNASLNGVNVANLSVHISGSGGVTTGGTVQSQDVSVSGSGSYNGEHLDSQHATIDVSGSGSVTAKVSDSLKVHVSGSGSVTYIGDPQVTDRQVTGSGSIHQR